MKVTRRPVITAWNRVKNDEGLETVVPTRGHLIGAASRSLLSLHRRVVSDLARQMQRKAKGRFVWWPNMDKDPADTQEPAVNTRQVRRATKRAEDKIAASQLAKALRLRKQALRKQGRFLTGIA